MSQTFDVAVAGAGIVGAACAAQLAADGLRVGMIEGDLPARGATAAAMGHVVVMDDSPAQFALTCYAQELWRDAADSLPEEVHYSQCGTLWIAADEEEMGEVRRKHPTYLAAGLATEILDGQALAEAEPNLRPSLAGALLVHRDAVLSPPAATMHLIAGAQARGAVLVTGKAVVRAGRGELLVADGTTISAAHIVVATGAAAAALVPGLPLVKRKGQLAITERYPGYVRRQLVELGYLKSAHTLTSDSVAFNVQPRWTGELVIGSSRQTAGQSSAEDGAIDAEILDAMLRRAYEYMPGLRELATVRAWSGFRAATPDKLPLIGPSEDPTVLLATGHEGLGITTSLATGRLLADGVMGRASAISREPYLPSRLVCS